MTDHRLLLGDAALVLADLPAGSVDLIVTSPPYADARKSSYGGVAAGDYVEWFRPISGELLRVLKPSGSFILNIKEGCRHGERSTYVLELILALREQGWLWTEEYIWHKKHCYPGKWPNRFRDAWERLLQFNKSKTFAMYQESVMVPSKAAIVARGRQLHPGDDLQVVSGSGSGLSRRMASCVRVESRTGSRFGRTAATIEGRSRVLPDNVLYLAVETRLGRRSRRTADHPRRSPGETPPDQPRDLGAGEGVTTIDGPPIPPRKPVSKFREYGAIVTPCPPRRGNRKGAVECGVKFMCGRWWRTMTATNPEEAQVSLDHFWSTTGDARLRPPGRYLDACDLAPGERPVWPSVGALAE
ncbi:MAG: DNA-methyltransferase, partial [Trebonia sp.]